LWKSTSEKEKEPFKTQAAQDKERYMKEKEAYEKKRKASQPQEALRVEDLTKSGEIRIDEAAPKRPKIDKGFEVDVSLPPGTTHDQIQSTFGQYGEILSILYRIPICKIKTNDTEPVLATLYYATKEQAIRAIIAAWKEQL
jgi:hypothetical protein